MKNKTMRISRGECINTILESYQNYGGGWNSEKESIEKLNKYTNSELADELYESTLKDDMEYNWRVIVYEYVCPNCTVKRINPFPVSDETNTKYCPDCNYDL